MGDAVVWGARKTAARSQRWDSAPPLRLSGRGQPDRKQKNQYPCSIPWNYERSTAVFRVMRALAADLTALWRGRALLWMMIRREMAARFAGSALGLVWLYVQPVLMIAVYYFLFEVIFHARIGSGQNEQSVGVYLIVGMVPWMTFSDAVSRGMHSLVQDGALLKKNPLPAVLLPARMVAASAITFVPLFGGLAIAFGWSHGGSASMMALPLLLVSLLLLAFFFAYAMALLTAAVRDSQQVVGLLLSLGVFASPVLYPMASFPDGWRWLLWLNPITPVVLGFQSVLLYQTWPGAALWWAIAAWCVVLAWVLNRFIGNSREVLVDWL